MNRDDSRRAFPPIIRHARVTPFKRQTARELRRDMTRSEQLAWQVLRNRRMLGLKFRRQQVIRGYIVDFYCAELRVVLEIDGHVHDGSDRALRDAVRDVDLLQLGIITLRIPAEGVTAATLWHLLEPFVRRAPAK